MERLMLENANLSVVTVTKGKGEDSFEENEYCINGEIIKHELDDETVLYDGERSFFHRFLFSEHYAIKLKETYNWNSEITIVDFYRGTPEEIEILYKGFHFYF